MRGRTLATISLLLCTLLAFANVQNLAACSTFCLRDGSRVVFGRNLDWVYEKGFVCFNNGNVNKTALIAPTESPTKWTSRFGSVTFNQVAIDMPYDGMNEAGLVVAQMWLSATQYPPPDNRPAITELQWIQYVLDNFSTVEEVIRSDSLVRISQSNAPLHYLVCDSSGAAATIEFIGGKMVYHTSELLPVTALTNSTYDQSLECLSQHVGFGGEQPISGSDGSLDRFVRCANMLNNYVAVDTVDIVDYAFKVLSNVAQSSTVWSIVYDIENRKIHFRTASNFVTKRILLSDVDFSCDKKVRILDLDTDVGGEEDILVRFVDYTPEINGAYVSSFFEQMAITSSLNYQPPPEVLDIIAKYPETFTCKEYE